MSTRPIIKPFPVFSSSSMATSLTSPATIISNLSGVGYDIAWTGAPVGTFSVQISNTVTLNAQGAVATAGSWTTLTLSSSIAAAGSADNAFINLAGVEAYAIRLVYTRSSGTGTLNATISGKV